MATPPPLSLPAGVADQRKRHSIARVIIATSLGNGLEMLDFTIYSFFAVTIGKLFFPVSSPYGSLLLAVATFGIGFVVRPLGGIIIGNYADRAGRKSAMTLTISLMALGTALIGLTPSYASIGMFAPLLVVTGRLLQGLSAGGEIGASTTLLMESGKAPSRGFLVSWQLASQGAAALCGALSGALLSHLLSESDLQTWGWRMPFLAGLLIGPVGLYIRNSLDETLATETRERSPFSEVFREHMHALVTCTLLIVGSTAAMYIVIFYMPTYMIRVLRMQPSTAFLSGCVSGAVLLIGAPLSGLLADRIQRRKPIVVVATMASAIAIYPAFYMLSHRANLTGALCVVAVLVGLLALGSAPIFLPILESFPGRVRATGMGAVYSFGVSLFGGFAQFIVTWLISTTGNPMSRGFDEQCLIPEIVARQEWFIDIRRRLHAHPELGAEVGQTAALVAECLEGWGYEVYRNVGGHGVVARLRRGNGRRSIGIRADMDALPISETTGLPYASKFDDRMHACGHDGHTAILLAAAWYLARHGSFNGTLHLIFQPDEENLSGARRMIEDGVFERFPCDSVFALHNAPGIPVGQFVVQDGSTMAASDIATVTLTGVGGHGAMPERSSDPIVAAGALILALQTIVSRNLAARDVGVVSIGAIHGGTTHNVIPDSVRLLLNIRSTSAEVRSRIEQRVQEIVTAQATSFGVGASIDYTNLVPVVMNAQEPSALARRVTVGMVGRDNVHDNPGALLGSEDFAWISHAVPACYVLIGNGVGKLGGCMCHNAGYDFNDTILALGASFWVRLVNTYLRNPDGIT